MSRPPLTTRVVLDLIALAALITGFGTALVTATDNPTPAALAPAPVDHTPVTPPVGTTTTEAP